MKFKEAMSKIMEDNELEFMSETGKILSVNYNREVIITSNYKTTKVITSDELSSEIWNELLTRQKTFNELLKLHTEYKDIQFQVKHKGQEEDDFEARTVKYYLNEFMEYLIENFSSSEIAIILMSVEIFTE